MGSNRSRWRSTRAEDRNKVERFFQLCFVQKRNRRWYLLAEKEAARKCSKLRRVQRWQKMLMMIQTRKTRTKKRQKMLPRWAKFTKKNGKPTMDRQKAKKLKSNFYFL